MTLLDIPSLRNKEVVSESGSKLRGMEGLKP